MRSSYSPPSPDSGESFFLHDPQEVIYNRIKDVFESDTSVRDEPYKRANALTVQAEIHSSSSGAASGSEEEASAEAMSSHNMMSKSNNKTTAILAEQSVAQSSNNHDYEDIYLVREEAKNATKKLYGRSRSRDSGSHSRSASASSTRSHDVIVHSPLNVRNKKIFKYF